MLSETELAADRLAREMHSAALVVEGFCEESATKISLRGYPESLYEDAVFLLSQDSPVGYVEEEK